MLSGSDIPYVFMIVNNVDSRNTDGQKESYT